MLPFKANLAVAASAFATTIVANHKSPPAKLNKPFVVF
jgi:hypothetical protein